MSEEREKCGRCDGAGARHFVDCGRCAGSGYEPTPTPARSEAAGGEDRAIADLQFFRQTHVDWAEHFEKHPELAAQYVATGEWDDANEHRRIVQAYDNALAVMASLRQQLAAAREEGERWRTIAPHLRTWTAGNCTHVEGWLPVIGAWGHQRPIAEVVDRLTAQEQATPTQPQRAEVDEIC